MLDFVRGTLRSKSDSTVVVETNGVGFACETSTHTIQQLPSTGETLKLCTHLHPREKDVDLYGFFTETEREMFTILISASRIGPKTALSLLSQSSPQQITQAIMDEHLDLLTQARGIGEKTARRLVLETQDEVSSFSEHVQSEPSIANDLSEEAIKALKELGYQAGASQKAVKQAAQEHPEVEESGRLVKLALQHIS